MPEKKFYHSQDSYANDPDSYVGGIIELVTAQTGSQNSKKFTKQLVRAYKTRKYLDLNQVLSVLTQIHDRWEKSPATIPDWRLEPLGTAIKTLSETVKK